MEQAVCFNIEDRFCFVSSHCVGPFLIGIAGARQNQGVGKSDSKQGLHKPDLTYFVKRLKCKLTENVFSPHHLLLASQPAPLEDFRSFLTVAR